MIEVLDAKLLRYASRAKGASRKRIIKHFGTVRLENLVNKKYIYEEARHENNGGHNNEPHWVGVGQYRITDTGEKMLADYRANKREECFKYWITTSIAVIAIILSIISLILQRC